jgi:hypothetical protein
MITQAERNDINAELDAAGYRDYEDGLYKFQVILDDPMHVYYTGSYEGCKQFIRCKAAVFELPLDILSLETKRLVSYVL